MPPDPQMGVPSAIIVMGVSGSGKSTVTALLANRLGWTYEDADWFHPPENVEKMHSGQPLTDEDRWPWLQAIAAHINTIERNGNRSVIACSALKRSYRDVLIGSRRDVRLVYLKGSRELIAHRMAVRHGHFMPLSLLASQFRTLEEPTEDEHAVVVSIEPRPAKIVDTIVAQLGSEVLHDEVARATKLRTTATVSPR
jgi:gluconokinase